MKVKLVTAELRLNVQGVNEKEAIPLVARKIIPRWLRQFKSARNTN